MENQTSNSLRKVFLFDAAVCGLIGLDLMLFSDQVASLMGSVSSQVYLIVGVVLSMWAADLALLATNPKWLSRFARLVIYVDWASVAAILLLVVGFAELFSGLGITLLLAAAIGGAVIALMKQRGLGNSERLTVASA